MDHDPLTRFRTLVVDSPQPDLDAVLQRTVARLKARKAAVEALAAETGLLVLGSLGGDRTAFLEPGEHVVRATIRYTDRADEILTDKTRLDLIQTLVRMGFLHRLPDPEPEPLEATGGTLLA